LGFFTPGTLPDTDRTMLIDNFLSKSFVIISSAPVDGCHNALKFEMATVVGIAGEPVDLQVTVFDETDVVIRIVQISYVTGEHPFIGLFRPSGARIGRIDLWDRNGQAEGIVSLAGYRTRPCPDPNSDGTIDILDILVVLSEFGNESGPADVNSDGVVDVVDILYILAFWGTSCPICPVG